MKATRGPWMLYHSRPRTVEAYEGRDERGNDHMVVRHPDGTIEALPRDIFNARFAPVGAWASVTRREENA